VTITDYDMETVWRFGGYGTAEDYPGIIKAAFIVVMDITTGSLARAVLTVASMIGRVRELLFSVSVVRPGCVVRPIPQTAPECLASAAGALVLYERARSRCVPLNGPNHGRRSLSRAGDMT
jgi:hypothetical protein